MLTKKKCKEALEQLDLNCWGCEYACDMSDDKPCVLKEIIGKLIDEHFELVEKATLKKLEKKYMELKGFIYYNCVCPNCGKTVCFETQRDTVKHQVNYCWKCGQALDWSKEDVD